MYDDERMTEVNQRQMFFEHELDIKDCPKFCLDFEGRKNVPNNSNL